MKNKKFIALSVCLISAVLVSGLMMFGACKDDPEPLVIDSMEELLLYGGENVKYFSSLTASSVKVQAERMDDGETVNIISYALEYQDAGISLYGANTSYGYTDMKHLVYNAPAAPSVIEVKGRRLNMYVTDVLPDGRHADVRYVEFSSQNFLYLVRFVNTADDEIVRSIAQLL